MKFKSDKQRRCVMAQLKKGRMPSNLPTILKNASNPKLKRMGVRLPPNKDTDRDGIINKKDCMPLNKKEQGIIHNLVSGIGKIGGYAVGEIKSGWNDIPKTFKRSQFLTMEKEELKEAKRDLSALNKIQKQKESIINIKKQEPTAINKIRTNKEQIRVLENRRNDMIKKLQKGEIGFVKKNNKLIAVKREVPI